MSEQKSSYLLNSREPLGLLDNIVIPLWPYTVASDRPEQSPKAFPEAKKTSAERFLKRVENQPAKKHTADGIKRIVVLYGTVWLALAVWTCLTAGHFAGGGLYFQLIKYLLLGIIPLFALTRGITHLYLNSWGIRFEKRLPGLTRAVRKLAWANVEAIYLDLPSGGDPRRSKLCIRDGKKKIYSIKLSKIATSENWRNLLSAINAWSPVKPTNVDPYLFDSLSNANKDLTYTSLWLEALTAPPQRTRLTPLSEGSTLKQGSYVLERQLGKGGQGTAYLAASANGSKVVLKEYILPIYVDLKARKQALERFQNEAMMLGRLDHPGIVRLLDSFVDDHRAYLVLEFIDGVTLKTLVENQGPLESKQAAQFAVMMCDVLAYLHGQSPPVVHRDFTPDNLILSKNGTIKLIDFMIAQQVEETSTATIIGKHCYQSPEQFRGKANTQSDLYALGASLFFLLTGSDPEPIASSHPIIENQSVDPALDQIVAKCTAASLKDRYLDASQIKQDLERLLTVDPDEALLRSEG